MTDLTAQSHYDRAVIDITLADAALVDAMLDAERDHIAQRVIVMLRIVETPMPSDLERLCCRLDALTCAVAPRDPRLGYVLVGITTVGLSDEEIADIVGEMMPDARVKVADPRS